MRRGLSEDETYLHDKRNSDELYPKGNVTVLFAAINAFSSDFGCDTANIYAKTYPCHLVLSFRRGAL